MRQGLFVLLAASCLFAQSERGTITGVVADPSGAAIANANVSVIEPTTNSSAALTSSATGSYTAPNLTPGTYRVEVTAPGFKRTVLAGVIVSAASTVRLDVTMTLGQVSEAIEVSASAVQIQTENAKTSTVVQNKLVDELPLVVGGSMRSPFNLVSISAEARGDGNRLALGGGQAGAWDATLDGHSVGTNRSNETAEAALNSPSVEALTEFTVDTNGFKAEYGQAGGGVMTFVSKSGTNQFHGSAYDFLRNEKLDARGFFAPRRAVYKQNDFGTSLGGPVIIPKLYNGRDKTFFFFSFEGFRNREGANDVIRTVPTAEMYNGDFSKWVNNAGAVIPIYDPATTRPNPNGSGFIRDPFPNNQIPTARFSALSRQILPFAAGVRPNRATAIPGTVGYVTNNYISQGGTETTPTDKWSIKVDQMLGAKQRVNFLYNGTTFERTPGAAGPPGLPLPLWDGQQQAWDTKAYRVTHDYTLSSSLLNHFSFAANTFVKNSFSPNVGGDWKDKVCMKNVIDCNVNFPGLTFTEYSTWGGVAQNGTEQPGWGIKNDLSYIRGAHTFKFGYAFQDQRANGFGEQDISGRAGFSFLSTSVPGVTTLTSGNSFASFLLGEAFTGRTETIRAVTQYYRYHGLYAQDDWRISRKLTINIGLRFDTTLPPISATDEYSDFDPTRPNPAAGGRLGALKFAGEGPGREGSRSLLPAWYGGWGPRIGLAYSLTPKTTIRTGFGRSFSKVTAVQGSGHFAGFIGQYEFLNTNQGVTPTFRLDDGLPSYRLPPSIDPSFSNGNNVDWWQGREAVRAPENLYWTFSLQRQLTENTVIEAAYNSSIGTHLQTGVLNFNQVPSATLNNLIAQYGPTQALNLLRANIDSPTAVAAGIPIPYPNFVNERNKTVAQALRPFPQYLNIVTGTQNGDKSGHSTYHALVLKVDRRFSQGLTFQWNYTFSKLLTDSDTYYANQPAAQDHYNRRLEKSIGQNDQTHALKISTLYELPVGKGKRWISDGFLTHIIGGWRIGAIQTYVSGYPVALQRNNPLPIFNGQTRPVITTYDDWRAPIAGEKFDPNVDRFVIPANQFPAQPAHLMGNATRYNPKLRAFPGLNENVTIAKTFSFTETLRLDLRGEAFNVLNRTVFSVPNMNLNNNAFGIVTNQANTPRQMQVALKLYW